MRVSIRDRAVLTSVEVPSIRAYLSRRGWNLLGPRGPYVEIWAIHEPSSDRRLLVPKTPSLDDYASRVSDVIQALEDVEDRSQVEILYDLLAVHWDVIRVPVGDGGRHAGTIAIQDGALLIERSKDMVLAAAKRADTREPRRVYGPRRSQQVDEYMRSVRLGQTEHGSYVITVHSPVSHVLQQTLFEGADISEPDDPFSRQVTRTLARSLEHTVEAATEATDRGDLEPFDHKVEFGVSANLCAAVRDLNEANNGRGVAIQFSWSPARAVAADVPSRIQVPPRVIPAITDAERLFREREPKEDYDLEGVVVGLERAEDALIGKVKIRARLDVGYRTVSVEMPDADYRVASDAHRDRQPISCTGELVREGRSFELRAPRHVAVVLDDL